jgi:hypothetical protein
VTAYYNELEQVTTMSYGLLTRDKITLRNAGWTWNRKLRRWEKQDGDVQLTAKTMDDAFRIEWEKAQVDR